METILMAFIRKKGNYLDEKKVWNMEQKKRYLRCIGFSKSCMVVLLNVNCTFPSLVDSNVIPFNHFLTDLCIIRRSKFITRLQ